MKYCHIHLTFVSVTFWSHQALSYAIVFIPLTNEVSAHSHCSSSLQHSQQCEFILSSQRSKNNSLSLHNSFKKYIRKSWTNAFRNKPDLTFSKIYYLHPNAEGIHLRSFPKSCETPGIMANSYPFSAAFYLAQLFFWFCADEWKRDTAQWISLIPGSVSKAQGDSSWPSEHRIQLLTE